MVKMCDICKNALIIQLEYNLEDFEVILQEGCKHCRMITKSKLKITKQDIFLHLEYLLNQTLCTSCNKDIIIVGVNHCNLGLAIFIYLLCEHCDMHYIIVKPCNSKEELNKLCLLIENESIGSLIKEV